MDHGGAVLGDLSMAYGRCCLGFFLLISSRRLAFSGDVLLLP